MRIAYCTNTRLPSERAHAHQIHQVCEAMARLGHQVRLFAPDRTRVDSEVPYDLAEAVVKPEYFDSFDFVSSPWFPGLIGLYLLNWRLRRQYRTCIRADEFDLFYTRAPALVPALTGRRIPVILELHQIPRLGRGKLVRASADLHRIYCLTESMRRELARLGVPEERLAVEPDAVDLRRFDPMPSRAQARTEFGLDAERTVLGYVGRLTTMGMEKGVSDLLEAVVRLRKSHPVFAFIVGGPEVEAARYRKLAEALGLTEEDVRIEGSVAAHRVPTALACADLLVMPWPDLPHYRHYMSPLKMFEYMASSRPIVTSDLPTIRDVLDDESAVFCRAGDLESLVDSIQWALEHPEQAEAKALLARRMVESYTWERRMERILGSLEKV